MKYDADLGMAILDLLELTECGFDARACRQSYQPTPIALFANLVDEDTEEEYELGIRTLFIGESDLLRYGFNRMIFTRKLEAIDVQPANCLGLIAHLVETSGNLVKQQKARLHFNELVRDLKVALLPEGKAIEGLPLTTLQRLANFFGQALYQQVGQRIRADLLLAALTLTAERSGISITSPLPVRNIPTTLQIGAYIHCRQCLEGVPGGMSPASWQEVAAGWTRLGLQVWCKRHQRNILHLDFQGVKHRTNPPDAMPILAKEHNEAEVFISVLNDLLKREFRIELSDDVTLPALSRSLTASSLILGELLPKRNIPDTYSILTPIVCPRCQKKLPPHIKMDEWEDLTVGWTRLGLQVWCKRHRRNVLHIDFEGMKHAVK